MPKIKVQREENVIYEQEINSMFDKLKDKDSIRGTYDTHITKLNKETGEYETNLVIQTFNIDCRQTECLLALLWIFGRRIQEILLLKRRNLRVEEGFLIVQFRTLKRRKNLEELFEKSITLDNQYVKYITAYLDMLDVDSNMLDVSDAYLFPGQTRKRIIKSKAPLPRTGELKTYNYLRKDSGFMSPQKAWKIIKYLNPKAYCHLFRHSLATKIARKGFTESQLMSWFDWSTSDVAQRYVEKSSKLVEGLSKRTW